MILIIVLYNIDPSHLDNYGWYFLGEHKGIGVTSLKRDYETLELIIKYLNSKNYYGEEEKNLLFHDKTWKLPLFEKIVDIINGKKKDG